MVNSSAILKCAAKNEGLAYQPIYLETTERPKQNNIWNCDKITKILIGTLAIVLIILLEITYESTEVMEKKKYQSMFNEFIFKYDKKYDSPEIMDYRFHIFINNVREFEEEERKNPGLDLDVTQFADWTDTELKHILYHEMNMEEHGLNEPIKFENAVSRPASIDWRDQGKLTPVKNQDQCGSCWAFATVAAVEAQHAIKKGQLVSLSEQEMVDCDHRNNGCRGGYRPYAMNFVKKNGLEKEQEYPYRGVEGDQCLLKKNDTRVYISDYQMLSRNEDEIADWVATKGPVTFGMNVVKSMYSYRSGIFSPSAQDCQEKSMGSHALVIVGYGVEGNKPYWIVKNSWGTWWGASGYFRLARGVNSCGVANSVVAPVIN